MDTDSKIIKSITFHSKWPISVVPFNIVLILFSLSIFMWIYVYFFFILMVYFILPHIYKITISICNFFFHFLSVCSCFYLFVMFFIVKVTWYKKHYFKCMSFLPEFLESMIHNSVINQYLSQITIPISGSWL